MKAAQSSDKNAMDSALSDGEFADIPEENSMLGVDQEPALTPESSSSGQSPGSQEQSSPKPAVVSQSTQKSNQKITVVKL